MAVTINGTTGVDTPGNLLFSGTGQRITGDFSNATISNRLMFQSSTVNGGTFVFATPNGSGTSSYWLTSNSSDTANASLAYIGVNATEASVQSVKTGTGAYLPMTFYTGGAERVRIDTSGNVSIGGTSTLGKLDVTGSVYASASYILPDTGTLFWGSGDGSTRIQGNSTTDVMSLYTVGVERLKIDSSGRVTMPAQPAFLANHNLSTASTPSEIIWSAAVSINIGSCYSSTTGRFTAPVAGTYFFRTHILTSNAPAGETRVALCKNGVAYGGATTILVKPANTWATIIVTSHMYLAVGDYASVILVQLPASGALHSDANFNSFSGHLIG